MAWSIGFRRGSTPERANPSVWPTRLDGWCSCSAEDKPFVLLPTRPSSAISGNVGQGAEFRGKNRVGSVLSRRPLMTARTPDAEPLLTPAEVATMFRVDPKTVTRWAKAGKLTSIRTLGGHRRYREAEVRALLAGIPQQRSEA